MIETYPVADRASWLAMRQQDVTASDIGAVCGVDPWRSALRVYAEKTGIAAPSAENNAMRRGRWLEPAVVEALREEIPTWEIKRAGVYLRDPEIRIGATPDAVATDPKREGLGIVQCKVVSQTAFEREWPDGRAPLRYELQTLTEAMLADAAWACVVALVITTHTAELVVHPVERHAEAEQRIKNAVVRFWQGVVAERPPHPDYAIDGELIDALHKYPTAGLTLDLTGDNRLGELLADRASIKAALSDAEKQVRALDAEIKDKLADAEGATLPGWRISWKAQTRPAHVVPETTFRVLRVTKAKEMA